MAWAGLAAGLAIGAGVGLAAPRGKLPAVRDLGSMSFTDYSDLATRVMSVTGQEAKFNPQLVFQGYEDNAVHYLYFYLWPFQNPQDTQPTVDVGLVADLWALPGKWSVELANFDYDPTKVVYFDDGAGNTAAVPVLTTAFLTVTQV